MKSLTDKKISYVENDEKSLETFLHGRKPVLFSGASMKSWPVITPENQEEVRRAIRKCLFLLDPKKAVIMTGGTNYGVEKEVHEMIRHEAELGGFDILGTMVLEDMDAIEPETITHGILVADKWYEKSAGVLEMVKKYGGMVMFMGGGNILNDEIQAAYNIEAPFYLMDGPEGASTEKAKSYKDHAFIGAEGMETLLTREWSQLLRDTNAY